MSIKRVVLNEEYHDLLIYLVMYTKLRQPKNNKRTVVQDMILARAKQLVTGMPEELWRQNLIQLINEAERSKR